eukprot:Phypoly_transcript_10847.p1 GENE.Phypoly_transcript_10847~~Phypoly_transcript_10847.p1  ORF type:complete len:220 (+),score=22.32 Phypoly_transcript_10847:583-1242(+)
MASMGRKFAVPERQRIYIASPAQLISPFLPPEKAPSILSRQGISDHWRSVKNFLISLISSQQIRSKLKPLKEKFYSHTFRNTAAKYYEDINKAIAAGDTGKLRGMLTEQMYTTVSREIGLKERPHKGVNLSWEANLDTPRVVCVRFTRVSADKIEDFGQVTVYFSGKQTLNVNDVTGKVVSSISSPISEYWTFERHLQKFGTWRLCAKPTHTSIENMGF